METKNETELKYKKPSMYAVTIYNDDYTTMDFVTFLLCTVFNKNIVEATNLMMDIHEKGKSEVSIYSLDIANTKKYQAEHLAKEKNFPLKISISEVLQ
jgi:ATP-dependent Clp protease adaptor protein ClpS